MVKRDCVSASVCMWGETGSYLDMGRRGRVRKPSFLLHITAAPSSCDMNTVCGVEGREVLPLGHNYSHFPHQGDSCQLWNIRSSWAAVDRNHDRGASVTAPREG